MKGTCCRSSPVGINKDRASLVSLLVTKTRAATLRNADGETVLASLVESINLGSSSSTAVDSHRNARLEDAELQRFAVSLCDDWNSVYATIMTGFRADQEGGHVHSSGAAHDSDRDQVIQSSSAMLDRFVLSILKAEDSKLFDSVVYTLVREVNKDVNVVVVASRFIRSLVRIFAVHSSSMQTKEQEGRDQMQADPRRAKQAYDSNSRLLQRCRSGFTAFPALAVQELAESADSILAPVRLGLVVPQASSRPDAPPSQSSGVRYGAPSSSQPVEIDEYNWVFRRTDNISRHQPPSLRTPDLSSSLFDADEEDALIGQSSSASMDQREDVS